MIHSLNSDLILHMAKNVNSRKIQLLLPYHQHSLLILWSCIIKSEAFLFEQCSHECISYLLLEKNLQFNNNVSQSFSDILLDAFSVVTKFNFHSPTPNILC